MVSGFLTSPLDQERIDSGEATEMAPYSTWLTLSKPSNSRVDSLVIIISYFRWRDGPPSNLLLAEVGQSTGSGRLIERVGITHFDIHAEGLHFLDQHVEGFRN